MYMYIIRMVSSNSPSLRIFVVSCMVSRNSHHSNISRQKIETHHLGPGLIKIYMWKHHYCWSLMLHHNQNQQLHPLKLTCCHLKMEDDSRREVHQVHPLPHERSGTQKKHMVSKDMNLKKQGTVETLSTRRFSSTKTHQLSMLSPFNKQNDIWRMIEMTKSSAIYSSI